MIAEAREIRENQNLRLAAANNVIHKQTVTDSVSCPFVSLLGLLC